MKAAISVTELFKQYGSKTALDGITFDVSAGGCFGLLGPNGAGKSTTMKILSGLLEPDRGSVAIFGKDAGKERDSIKELIGYVPQSITLYEKLSARDNLHFFGDMYRVPKRELASRIGEVLEQVGLADRAKDAVSTFSGGMKRRVNIAAALLHRPKLIIMDEPTVGIDPQSRNHIFEMIRSLKQDGVTVLYSTHYMEEVEALCEDLAIVDHGRVIASGSLDEVLEKHGTQAVYLELQDGSRPPMPDGFGAPVQKGRGWTVETSSPLATLADWAQACRSASIGVKQLEIVRPSLEAVFLNLTGTTLRDN